MLNDCSLVRACFFMIVYANPDHIRPYKPDYTTKSDSKPAYRSVRSDQTRPGQARPGQARPGQARPGQARPGQARPGQARPGQARPGQARPGQARPGQARPGQARPGQARPGQARPEQNRTDKTALHIHFTNWHRLRHTLSRHDVITTGTSRTKVSIQS